MAEGWKVTSYMVGGLAWAGIGWAIDSLVGTFPILTSIGAVLGEAAAVYLIYLRYGKADD
jgi:F0F1-type ATP synthase assembly protein I